MLGQPFMRHALLAGTGIALAAGLVGYFVVLRSQVFTGDLLSHVAVAAAFAALAAGVDTRLGVFAGCAAVGIVVGLLGPRGRPDDVVTGSLFAWILGLGALLQSYFARARSGANGTAGVTVLFGSIFGLSPNQATTAAVVGAGLALAVLGLARPLMFASLDVDVAQARGVPVRALGVMFLVLVGLTAAETTQAVGGLLLLALLAGPAGAAHRLTRRPFAALLLSGGLAVVEMWAGLAMSYLAPRLPPSFTIVAVVSVVYLGATAAARWRAVPRRPEPVRSSS